jgi:hypothetical protein
MTKQAYSPTSVSLENLEAGRTPPLIGPPFFLAPTEISPGTWRFVADSRRVGRPLRILGVFLILLALVCAISFLYMDTPLEDLKLLTVCVFEALCGAIFCWLDHWQWSSFRWLEIDSNTNSVRLGKVRGQRITVTHSLPTSECSLRIHPISASNRRFPDWTGFAAVIHILDPDRRFEPGLFVLACAQSAVALERYLNTLPPVFDTVPRQEGRALNTTFIPALSSRSLRRESRGLCPHCGYALGPDPTARCPECGRLEPKDWT